MKNSSKALIGLAMSLLAHGAFAGPVTIVSTSESGSFPIVNAQGKTASFVIDAADAEVVRTAAEAVSSDIKLITGQQPLSVSTLEGVEMPIIAGTLGQSSFIDALARAGKINSTAIEGKWEAYGLEVVDNPVSGVDRALVAYGSTPAEQHTHFSRFRALPASPPMYGGLMYSQKSVQNSTQPPARSAWGNPP